MDEQQPLPPQVVLDGVLQDRVERRLDPSLRLEPAVEKVLQLMALDFAEEALQASVDLARHRGSNQVSVDDMATFLLHQYGMRIPPYTSRSMARMQEAQRELWAPPVVHRQRLEMRAQMMEQHQQGANESGRSTTQRGAK